MTAVLKEYARGYTPEETPEEVWASLARGYAAFGSPFVPCSEDISILEQTVSRLAEITRTDFLNAVVLGVTPGLVMMNWPSRSKVIAVDGSSAVIRALWPGDVPENREARCAGWTTMPVQKGTCHVVLGDGSLNVCRFPGEIVEVVRSVHRLLKDDGIFACRCYIRPPVPESVDSVFAALFGPEGLSVDHFKMRLYMAMQRSTNEGVAVKEAARLLEKYNLNERAMKERLGWSHAVTDPFALWPNSNAVYSFPDLNELRQVTDEPFEVIDIRYPSYELGHCCPTLIMRPKGAGGSHEQ